MRNARERRGRRRFLAQRSAARISEQPPAAAACRDRASANSCPRFHRLDESVRSAADVAQVARYQAGQIVVLKPMLLVLARNLRAATLARQPFIDVVLSTFLDGSQAGLPPTWLPPLPGRSAQGLANGSPSVGISPALPWLREQASSNCVPIPTRPSAKP